MLRPRGGETQNSIFFVQNTKKKNNSTKKNNINSKLRFFEQNTKKKTIIILNDWWCGREIMNKQRASFQVDWIINFIASKFWIFLDKELIHFWMLWRVLNILNKNLLYGLSRINYTLEQMSLSLTNQKRVPESICICQYFE